MLSNDQEMHTSGSENNARSFLFLGYLIKVNVLLENVLNKEDGRVIIENKGTGMPLDAFSNVWLNRARTESKTP